MDAPRWPNQVRAVVGVREARAAGIKRMCVTSPTGTGKTAIAGDLIKEEIDNNGSACVYTNRKILVEQLSSDLTSMGIDHSIRAADYEPDFSKSVQICSIQTEDSRSIKRKTWTLPKSTLVLVDECHSQRSEAMLKVQKEHLESGAIIVGLSATPLDLDGYYDHLIVAGTKKEGRDCGALVMARHFGIDEPDMRKFKPSVKTGEYKEGDIVKAIMSANVFGRVYDHWKLLNPDGKPTVLFAPGVAQSIWFAEEFKKKGVWAAHIDGENCWVGGERYTSNRTVREQILKDVASGEIKVVCNRFVLREGFNEPSIEHIIFATKIMSLVAYLQAGGRGLRACARTGKTGLIVQDHGGHWHEPGLGSLNVDRDWDMSLTENVIKGMAADALREPPDKKPREPICCPMCRAIRNGGNTCYECGYKATRSSRLVVQQDGKLVEHTGDIYKPRRVAMKADTARLWKEMYWRGKRADMTFGQCRGLFFMENYYFPPADIPLMPTRGIDWYKKVGDVPVGALVPDKNIDSYAGSLYE